MSYRIHLALSLRGGEPIAIARALLARDWHPEPPPPELSIDRHRVAAGADWFERFAGRLTEELTARWDASQYLEIHRHSGITRLERRDIEVNPLALVDRLASIPFEDGVVGVPAFPTYPSILPQLVAGRPLAPGHQLTGWGMAFRGDGHQRLVSRRWITHGGPWRVIRGPRDTTLLQFHDLGLTDPHVAWTQARPCLERLTHAEPGTSGSSGLVDTGGPPYRPLEGRYQPASRCLWVFAGAERITTTEMHWAAEERCRRRHAHGEPPLERIAFVFASPAAARAHLHDLWLRGLECWHEAGAGPLVRDDDGYEPTPPPAPAWVAAADARELNQRPRRLARGSRT
ncbi:MAG TPA: hypothetical protein VL172_20775 [Kofleriaceae bacterium]|nr:hypothetical protein [Kofleriaceae bacterium]